LRTGERLGEPQIIRACDEPPAVFAKLRRHEPAVREFAYPHGDIDPLSDDVDEGVVELEVDGQPRMRGEETAHGGIRRPAPNPTDAAPFKAPSSVRSLSRAAASAASTSSLKRLASGKNASPARVNAIARVERTKSLAPSRASSAATCLLTALASRRVPWRRL